MSVGGGSAHRSIRLPVVEYDVDGKPIVADSDGIFKAIENNGPVDHPSVAGRGASSSSSRQGDVRIWELTEKALQRSEPPTGGPPKSEAGGDKDVGPSTSLGSSAASDSRREAGGNPQYKRRVMEKQASDDSTLRSTTVSNASSSLLRRLRWRRSQSTKRRSESDAGGKRAGESGRRRNRGSRPSSKRKSGGYSIDKPRRRNSDIDVRTKNSGRRPDVVGDDGIGLEKQTNNTYWQEMIDESRRRQLSGSPPSSSRGVRKKTKQKSSPAVSNAGTRRSKSSSNLNDRRRNSSGGGSSGSGGSRFGGTPKMSPEHEASLESRQNGRQTDDVTSTIFSITSSNRGLVDVDEAVWTERRKRGDRLAARCAGRCSVGIILIVAGCLLVAVGIIRLLVCYWHEFGSSIWAGIPVCLN